MKSIIESMKFSANIPEDALRFLDQQVKGGKFRSRSAALSEAVYFWRTHQLVDEYVAAFQEDSSEWDVTVGDGLDEADDT